MLASQTKNAGGSVTSQQFIAALKAVRPVESADELKALQDWSIATLTWVEPPPPEVEVRLHLLALLTA